MKKVIFFITLILIILYVTVAFSANHYVQSNATGNGNGNDWTNAYLSLPNQLVRGDTYYIADGEYPSYKFDDSAQGALQIYIIKATSENHGTNSGWSNSYGDGVAHFTNSIYFESNYWVFDGVTGTDTNGHGFKINTSDCSSDSKIIRFNNGASHIKIAHVEMEHCGEDNAYRHDIVYCNTQSSDIYISYCYMHDVNRNVILVSNGTNWIIEYCVIADRHTTSDIHGQHIQGGPGLTTDIVIRYNIFRNCRGTGYIVPLDNSHQRWYVYGNVFYSTDINRYGSSSGLFGDTSGDACDYMYFYNNTVVDQGAMNNGVDFHKTSPSDVLSYNNIFINAAGGDFFNNGKRDYNAYDIASAVSKESHGQYISSAQEIFVDYYSDNFQLKSPTAPGVKLPSPFDMDINENERGEDNLFDRGAFEYVKFELTPPINLRFVNSN